MLRKAIRSVCYGSVFGVSLLMTAAFALQITGRNSDNQRSIFQAGIAASSTELGITASTTQTQVGAYQLSAGLSQITTANSADAVKLPSLSNLGSPSNLDAALNVVIINNTANTVQLFPFSSTDVIVSGGSAAGAGASKNIPTLTTADCWSVSTGRWYCQIS